MFRRTAWAAALAALQTALVTAADPHCTDSRSHSVDCARRIGHECPTCQRCREPHPPTSEDRPEEPETGSRDRPGMFVAPPRSGTVVEEAGSVGLRGLALHFPEIRIGLPTIELPSLVRYRSGAHMKIDQGVAPFVPLPGTGVPGVPAGEKAPKTDEPYEPESGDVPPPEPGEDELTAKCRELARMKAELDRAQQDLQAKVDELRRTLQQLQSCPPRCSAPPVPSEEVPVPDGAPNALLREWSPTGEEASLQATAPVRLLPLPPPVVHDEQGVRPSSYTTRNARATSRPATPRLQRLPPVWVETDRVHPASTLP